MALQFCRRGNLASQLGCLVGSNYVVINEITEQKIENVVTDRARVQVRFSSHFSFSHFSCSFSIIIIILSFIYPSFKNIYSQFPLPGNLICITAEKSVE